MEFNGDTSYEIIELANYRYVIHGYNRISLDVMQCKLYI